MTDWMKRFVVLDVETTGLDPYYDRIVEIGIAVFENCRWVHQADYFVNPEGRILRQEVINVHGISTEMVMDAPPFYEVYNKIAPYLYDSVPVGYNVSFDRRFLTHAVTRAWPRAAFHSLPPALRPDVRWLDVNPLARWLVPNLNKYKLALVAEHLGFDTKEAHRADYDAKLAGAVLFKLMTDHPNLDWSYEATMARAKLADTEYNAKRFFWNKPDQDDPEAAWLGNGRPIQVYECDICYGLGPGVFKKKGWEPPRDWAYYGQGTANEKLTCSAACDNVAMWHYGVLRG